MKKRIVALAVIVICLSILASTTVAYFNDIVAVRNVITSGSVDVTLLDQRQVGDQLVESSDDSIRVVPAQKVSKIISVKGGAQDAYVRMRYQTEIFDAAGVKMELDEQTIASLIIIEPDTENWILKDGWWYYDDILSMGEVSEPLFTEIEFSGPNMTDEYQGCTVKLIITTHAVQYANNGNSVMEAVGWPEE